MKTLNTWPTCLLELKARVVVPEVGGGAGAGGAGTPADQVVVGGAVEEADQHHRHVVTAQPPGLAVRRQAARHQLLADLTTQGEGGLDVDNSHNN